MAIFIVSRSPRERPRKRSSKIGAEPLGSMPGSYGEVQEDLMRGLVDGLRRVIEHPAGQVGERGTGADRRLGRAIDEVDAQRDGGDRLHITVIARARTPAPRSPRAPPIGVPSPSHAPRRR